MFTYSLDHIPFSLAGSFLIVTSRGASPRLRYATSSGQTGPEEHASDFFEIALLRDGEEVPYTWEAQPHRLDLHAGNGGVTMAFADEDTLLFRAEEVTLRLVSYREFEAQYSPARDHVCFVDCAARGIHQLRAGKKTHLRVSPPSGGQATSTSRVQVDFLGSCGAIRFSRHEEKWHEALPVVDKTLKAREKEITKWLKRLPAVPERYRPTAEQAWFVLWNCQVPKGGALSRRAIYMSKFSPMNNIWAWDNCFTALAVAEADPDLAWDQLRLFFDHQDPHGLIPDLINDREALYGFTKPPLYGWAIHKLVKTLGLKKALPAIKHLYEPVSLLTEWWYKQRDFDNDGMCQYHHGNDSGWDNATVFDQGYPTEGADLAAYLVLQSEGLAMMGKALKRKISALRWEVRAREQLEDLLAQAVKDDHFISTLDGQSEAAATDSLLNYMPLVLGHHLPKKLRAALVADLRPGGKFLTDFGLASEAPASPKYQPDGYWRGPVWAAPTYLLFDGLVDGRETELAATLAERFCNLVVQAPGFWENYDALRGQGLRCPGYSWTAAVFLLLAQWLARREKKNAAQDKKNAKKEA